MRPPNKGDLQTLALIEFKRHRPEAAWALLDRALTLGDDPIDLLSAARISLLGSDIHRAAQHIEQAVRADPACAQYVDRAESFAPFRSMLRGASQRP